MYIWLLIVSSICLLINCQKEEAELLELSDCRYNYTEPAVNKDSTFTEIGVFGGPQRIYQSRYQYHSPRFNPNNPDEILYVRLDTEASMNGYSYQIRIFNFCTGEDRILTEHGTDKIDWGKNGWIAFNGMDSDMRMIKANGDSLTRITFGSITSNPIWDNRGESLFFRDNKYGYKMRYYPKTNTIDTLDVPYGGIADWVNDDVVLCGACHPYCGVFYYNMITDELTKVEYSNPNGGGSGLHYMKQSDKILWGKGRLILVFTPFTENRTVLTEGSDNRSYIQLNLSPDERTIVSERIDVIRTAPFTHKVQHSIYLMNIDGTDERKVVFPE